MTEEEKIKFIKDRIEEDITDLLLKYRMHPTVKRKMLSLMVDYATLKENSHYLMRDLKTERVGVFSPVEDIKKAVRLKKAKDLE